MPIFRRASEKDIIKIAELERENFTDAWSKQSIAETLVQKQAFITVAEKQGEVVGYCIVYYVMDEAEIARIAISSEMRRQGIGKELLDYTVECCREKQIDRLLLDVRESNQNAIAFYTAYGFGEDGIRKNFYECPQEHAVLMSKDLV